MATSEWGMIATWRMAFEGVCASAKQLAQAGTSRDSAVAAVKCVEDYPYYKSVGYGGLPNAQGEVELDAAFMDGNSMAFGAVAGIRNIANPVLVAEALSHERFNNFMVGSGAEQWAIAKGFEQKTMLTERASQHYHKRCRETLARGLNPYMGHDTVGIIAIDQQHHLCVATSTSGLFMKLPGRVGDSPVCGSGLYADSSIGAATATGLGEDLMKGCVSYEIVQRMGRGMPPQDAAESTVNDLATRLMNRYGRVGDLSVVCMNADGEFGVATNIDNFSFVVATHQLTPKIYLTWREGPHTCYREADEAWLAAYQRRITGEIL